MKIEEKSNKINEHRMLNRKGFDGYPSTLNLEPRAKRQRQKEKVKNPRSTDVVLKIKDIVTV